MPTVKWIGPYRFYFYSKEELSLLMRELGFSKYEITDNDREFYVKVTL